MLEALLEGQEFELPSGLVDEEIARAMERQQAEFRHSGMDPGRLQLEPSMFEEAARRRVSLGLLMAETVKVHGIQVDPERVRQRIETIASTYEDEAEVINYYYSDPQRLSYIESTVLEDQIVDWILERAQLREESMSFDQVLSPGQTSEVPSPVKWCDPGRAVSPGASRSLEAGSMRPGKMELLIEETLTHDRTG